MPVSAAVFTAVRVLGEVDGKLTARWRRIAFLRRSVCVLAFALPAARHSTEVVDTSGTTLMLMVDWPEIASDKLLRCTGVWSGVPRTSPDRGNARSQENRGRSDLDGRCALSRGTDWIEKNENDVPDDLTATYHYIPNRAYGIRRSDPDDVCGSRSTVPTSRRVPGAF